MHVSLRAPDPPLAPNCHPSVALKRNEFQTLFVDQRSALVEYATPIVGDRNRAEDLVQEAFIRFAPSIQGATTVEQPAAYLARIVRNLAYDWNRRRRIERRQEAAEPEWWMLPEAPTTPEQSLMRAESLAKLEQLLADQPQQVRQAVALVRFEGYTVAQAGVRLGVSGATVSRMVSRAMVEIVAGLNGDDLD